MMLIFVLLSLVFCFVFFLVLSLAFSLKDHLNSLSSLIYFYLYLVFQFQYFYSLILQILYVQTQIQTSIIVQTLTLILTLTCFLSISGYFQIISLKYCSYQKQFHLNFSLLAIISLSNHQLFLLIFMILFRTFYQ